jgi:RND family efflux transporter MFP subunit
LALQAGCKEQQKPQPPPPPKVTVAQPVQQAVTDSLDLTGNTQAIYTVQLVARVVGYLEKVLFQDGQQVKKGQPLFVIQQNTYEDNLRQAEAAVLQYRAQVQWTESQLTRYSNLIQRNAAARSDVENWHFQRDTAAANLRAAEAQRDLAKLNLDYTLVTAPFDGRMDRRLVDPGNLVGSGGNSTVLARSTRSTRSTSTSTSAISTWRGCSRSRAESPAPPMGGSGRSTPGCRMRTAILTRATSTSPPST